MTVAELIKKLQTFDGDKDVTFTFETVVEEINDEDVYLTAEGNVMIGNDYTEEFKSGDFFQGR